MLIEESHVDVPTKAGGDMSISLSSCFPKLPREITKLRNRNIRIPSEDRWVPEGQIFWSGGLQ